MLTEDAVIEALREHLAADGWQIVSWAAPNQDGTVLVALRGRHPARSRSEGRRQLEAARHGMASHSTRPR